MTMFVWAYVTAEARRDSAPLVEATMLSRLRRELEKYPNQLVIIEPYIQWDRTGMEPEAEDYEWIVMARATLTMPIHNVQVESIA